MKDTVKVTLFMTVLTAVYTLGAIQFYREGDMGGVIMMAIGSALAGFFSLWAWAGLIEEVKRKLERKEKSDE